MPLIHSALNAKTGSIYNTGISLEARERRERYPLSIEREVHKSEKKIRFAFPRVYRRTSPSPFWSGEVDVKKAKMSQGHQVQNKAANTEDEEEGKEKRKGIVTRVKHILTIKSVERPKSEVRHPEVVRESGGPKENENDDEGYLNQDSLLMDGSLDKSRLYDILSQEKSRRGANKGDEPIRESGNEPNRGDNEADKVKMRRPKVSKAAQVNEDGSLEDEGRPSSTFFQRGSMLVSSVRSSIRKMTASGKRKSTISDGVEEASGSPFDSAALKPPGTRSSCNESQDSGLGEDSDFDPNSSSLSARTPTPAGVILTSGSSRPSSSSLRKVSGGSSAHDSDHSLKKHVIIREPSLSALPSTNRKRRQYQNECCLETAKIYSRPTRIPEANATRKSVAERGGSVSSQWDHLFQLARAEGSRNSGSERHLKKS